MKTVNIDVGIFKGYTLILNEDGNFHLENNNKKIVNEFKDKKGYIVYFKDNENGEFVFKHDLAKDFLIDNKGTNIIFIDGNYSNTNLNNLLKCSYKEYRDNQVEKAEIYDEKIKKKKKNAKNNKKGGQKAVHKDYIYEGDKFYQILLPNGKKKDIKKNNSLEEKKQIVEELLSEWELDISNNWESRAVKTFLDCLSNYLIWHKDEEYESLKDKGLLSKGRQEKMDGKKHDKNLDYIESDETMRLEYM